MNLTSDERTELESVISVGYDGSVSARAQIVLWWADGRSAAEIAAIAGTTKPTVYKWIDRYEAEGLPGLDDRKSTGRPRSVPGEARSRILLLTRIPPPPETGLTHWSSYEMAKYLKRHEGISVSHNFISELWRENDLKPHLQGTFKVSKDPPLALRDLRPPYQGVPPWLMFVDLEAASSDRKRDSKLAVIAERPDALALRVIGHRAPAWRGDVQARRVVEAFDEWAAKTKPRALADAVDELRDALG
ncbi:MAG TPA: helix-turn-helix domain-containing protein [Streptosporangiaceae bacterium]|nr:helix-turn-helix domain-containing protein [Streptosporangiaceae bacterium]